MKKTPLMAIVVLCLAVSVAVIGFMFTTKESTAPQEANPFVQVGDVTSKWNQSAHADASSSAFRHWDEDGEIPVDCARCHASTGMLDYLGADGTAAGVDMPAKLGSVVDCSACHNEVIANTTAVTFPSQMEVEVASANASCFTCHQGMEGGINGRMDNLIGTTGLDEKAESLRAVDPHYLNVAGLNMGSESNAGYQYEGKVYAARFEHANSVETCTDCHDPHTLHLADPGIEKCSMCHAEVVSWPDLKKIRRTKADLDGDGNTSESTFDEIDGLLKRTEEALKLYSKDNADAQIGIVDHYPYWFMDANGNGAQDEGEGSYKDWTPRMMHAAFNYKLVKTTGAFVHNPVYAAQLLIDSIEDLASSNPSISADGLKRPEG